MTAPFKWDEDHRDSSARSGVRRLGDVSSPSGEQEPDSDASLRIEITLRGITPLDDVVYYIRECASRVEAMLHETARCVVVAERLLLAGDHTRFDVRVRLLTRHHDTEDRCVDGDLYVALWRAFDVTMRRMLRARDGGADDWVARVREVTGTVLGPPPQARPSSRALLAATRVRCQRGGPERSALRCPACPRFVNFKPSADRMRITIRCQWSGLDPVGDLMTLSGALVTVSPADTTEQANETARAHGIHHLLVAQDGRLVGIVCRCDLAGHEHGEVVADRMSTTLFSADPQTTLHDAAALMSRHRVRALPVMEGEQLLGIVSHTDLRAAGVDERRLVVSRSDSPEHDMGD